MSGFNGIVKVSKFIAENSALNCICYIERERNRIFHEIVDSLLSDPPIINFMSEEYKFFGHWFRSYKLFMTRDEAKEYARKRYNLDWLLYGRRDYKTCNNIIKLCIASDDYVYLNPVQADIIVGNKEGMFNNKE